MLPVERRESRSDAHEILGSSPTWASCQVNHRIGRRVAADSTNNSNSQVDHAPCARLAVLINAVSAALGLGLAGESAGFQLDLARAIGGCVAVGRATVAEGVDGTEPVVVPQPERRVKSTTRLNSGRRVELLSNILMHLLQIFAIRRWIGAGSASQRLVSAAWLERR